MGIVEATFIGLVLLAILVCLGAIAVAVAMGALTQPSLASQDAQAVKAARRMAKAVTWRVVTTQGSVCLCNGHDRIELRGARIQVLS